MQRRETSEDDDDGEEVISFLESPAARNASKSNSSNVNISSLNPMSNSKKDKYCHQTDISPNSIIGAYGLTKAYGYRRLSSHRDLLYY